MSNDPLVPCTPGVLPTPLTSLPRTPATLIFAALDPRERARCATLSRALHLALKDPALWRTLVFSDVVDNVDAVVQGAVAKARGELRLLDVSRLYLRKATLARVLRDNCQSLTHLLLGPPARSPYEVAKMVDLAPALVRLVAEVEADSPEALPLLRRSPPFGALGVRELLVQHGFCSDYAAREALGPALAAHVGLSSLGLDSGDGLGRWWAEPGNAVRFLTSLVGHPTLRRLDLTGNKAGSAAPTIGAAIAALVAGSPALQELYLVDCGLGQSGVLPVLHAMGSSRLLFLDIRGNALPAALLHWARDTLGPRLLCEPVSPAWSSPARGWEGDEFESCSDDWADQVAYR